MVRSYFCSGFAGAGVAGFTSTTRGLQLSHQTEGENKQLLP